MKIQYISTVHKNGMLTKRARLVSPQLTLSRVTCVIKNERAQYITHMSESIST